MTRHPLRIASLVVLGSMAFSPTVSAQSGSLFHAKNTAPAASQAERSWTYQTPDELHVIKLHDLVTVLVDERTLVALEGALDQKKKIDGKMVLTDWSILAGWTLFASPQSRGAPAAGYTADAKYKAEGELETLDAVESTITCEVVDIRPNGHLVLLGRREMILNHEELDFMFEGTIDPEDILPNRTVMSEKVLNPRIQKLDAGSVRDGYRRGWAQRWLDKYRPF